MQSKNAILGKDSSVGCMRLPGVYWSGSFGLISLSVEFGLRKVLAVSHLECCASARNRNEFLASSRNTAVICQGSNRVRQHLVILEGAASAAVMY